MAKYYGFELVELEVSKEHMHVSLNFPSRYSNTKVLGILKNISAGQEKTRHLGGEVHRFKHAADYTSTSLETGTGIFQVQI